MHAMQQPIPMSTGTQTKLSTVLLTHYRSSESYNQRGATGLPCIACPETMSSGNTQQLGTKKTTALFMLAEHSLYYNN